MNSQVKHKLTRATSLKELWELIIAVETKTKEKIRICTRDIARNFLNHPLLREIQLKYSRWASEQMHYQFMLSLPLVVESDRAVQIFTQDQNQVLSVSDRANPDE